MQITRASRHYVFLCSVTAGLTACTGSNSTYRGSGAAVATTAKSLGLSDDSLASLIQASRAEDSNATSSIGARTWSAAYSDAAISTSSLDWK